METFDVDMNGTFAAPPKGQPMPGQAAQKPLTPGKTVAAGGLAVLMTLAVWGTVGFVVVKVVRAIKR